jgi:hypothetical protein
MALPRRQEQMAAAQRCSTPYESGLKLSPDWSYQSLQMFF